MKKLLLLLLCVVFSCKLYSQTNGLSLFDESYVHRIDLTFTQLNFWDSLSYYYNQTLNNGAPDHLMVAKVKIDTTTFDSIGVKQKGYYSNWGAGTSLKKPLKIDLDEFISSHIYDGIKKINLANGFEDPSMMRDVLAYRFMRNAGINAPRTSYAKLYINNTYWGLYVVIEQVDKRALKNWFPSTAGNLFKCIDNTSLSWQGTTIANYTDEFSLETNKTTNDWTKFVKFVNKINNSGTSFKDSINALFNVPQYLKILACDVLMYNWDSYYDHGRNFYLYENPTTNLIEWIPWDYNLAFSGTTTNIIIPYTAGPNNKPLVKNTQSTPLFKTAYFTQLCNLLNTQFTNAILNPFIDSTANRIRPALTADPNKFFTISEFNNSLTNNITVASSFGNTIYRGLKSFITSRQATVRSQLFSNGFSTCAALGFNEIDKVSILIYPTVSSGIFNISSEKIISIIDVYDLKGERLLTLSPKLDQVKLNLTHFADGLYFIKIKSFDQEDVIKIIKQN